MRRAARKVEKVVRREVGAKRKIVMKKGRRAQGKVREEEIKEQEKKRKERGKKKEKGRKVSKSEMRCMR